MRAEEKAHRLPVLLSIPLVTCMLPVMIGVLMLPAVIRSIRQVLPAIGGGLMKKPLLHCCQRAWPLRPVAAMQIEVRSIKQPLAEGRQPANIRVAEGNAQLALGNVGLAIEAYRKALREQPDNVDAMMGLATCYDRMGRSDLSRRHYEMALAVEPANTDVYSHFAQSLDAQGQRDEAARVKTELAARVVAPEASREVPGSVPVLPPPPAQSVTVALAPPRSLPVAVERPAGNGVRLERLSMREVALVTCRRSHAGKPGR